MSNSLQNHIGLGKESVYGTKVAPTVFIPTLEPAKGISINMDKQFRTAIKGTPGKNQVAFNGLAVMECEYELDAYPDIIGHVFNSALGAPSSALVGAETVVYKHTFTDKFTKPSYTIEEKFGDIVKRYGGFIFNGFELTAKKGEAVMLSFTGQGQNQGDVSASTPSYETNKPFNFAQVSALSIGALDVLAMCEEISIEYSNGVAPRHAIGDNYPKAMVPGQSEHKGKITLYLDSDNKAIVEDYIANTERSLTFTATGAAIGDASNHALTVTAAKLQFTSTSEEVADNYNVLEIEYEAIEDATNGIIKVELTNLIASY